MSIHLSVLLDRYRYRHRYRHRCIYTYGYRYGLDSSSADTGPSLSGAPGAQVPELRVVLGRGRVLSKAEAGRFQTQCSSPLCSCGVEYIYIYTHTIYICCIYTHYIDICKYMWYVYMYTFYCSNISCIPGP